MNDISQYDESAYTAPLNNAQYFVMRGVATIPCILSWFGSFSIIYIARLKVRSNIYHRLLFIMSCIDVNALLWASLNPILMNSETGYQLAIGTQGTCTTVGFVLMFSILSKSFFSCYIALYFMLSVRYKWSDKRIELYEKYMSAFAFMVPLSYGIIGFINQAFNPNEFRLCYIAKYPIGCQGTDCIRGSLAPMLSLLNSYTNIFICLLAILFTALLFVYVRHQTKQTLRHEFVGTIGSSISIDNRKQDDRGRLVRTQTILYVLANINHFIWLLMFNHLVLKSTQTGNMADRESLVFVFGILLFLFMPLHGFLNFCIYCYPRLRRIKEYCPDNTWWWCLRQLYTKDQGESEITARRLLKRSNFLRTSTGVTSFSGVSETLDQQEQHAKQEQFDAASQLNDEIPELKQ